MRTLLSLFSRLICDPLRVFPRLDTPTEIDDECPPETDDEHEALLAAVYAQLGRQLPPDANMRYPGTDIPCVDPREPRVSEIFRR